MIMVLNIWLQFSILTSCYKEQIDDIVLKKVIVVGNSYDKDYNSIGTLVNVKNTFLSIYV